MRCAAQAEDADRAAERAEAAQGQRAEAMSRLQDAHRRKARQLADSVEAVQQARPHTPVVPASTKRSSFRLTAFKLTACMLLLLE